MITNNENEKKENAILSIGWLFGGNYINEQVEIFERIINDFEGLCYLERQHIIDILNYIYNNEIDNKEILQELMEEYEKQQ